MKGCIRKVGCYLPETEITNAALAARYNVDSNLILNKTGIETRRYAALNQKSSDLAYEACKNLQTLLELPNFDFVEALVLSTATPDTPLPGSVHSVQEKINRLGIPVYELRGGSGDFLKALELGSLLIETKRFHDVLVIGVDSPSKRIDLESFDTGILFGDGAGVFHLTDHTDKQGLKIIDFVFGADGSGISSLYYDNKLIMDGKVVMLEAITRVKQTVDQLLIKNNLKLDQIDHFVFHQANLRLLEFIAKTLDLTEKQVHNNIKNVGNTSNASIPLCLADLLNTKEIYKGQKMVLAGFSSGFSYGACLVEVC